MEVEVWTPESWQQNGIDTRHQRQFHLACRLQPDSAPSVSPIIVECPF
jgi:hypothetical protein